MEEKKLTNITHWSHIALSEVLRSGDLAVDLTVGNGKDTLFLWCNVCPDGCVVGFDIQTEALEKAAALLKSHGASVEFPRKSPAPISLESGIHLVQADHAAWPEFVARPPRAVIANLGYLPGSDSRVATQIQTTIQALAAALGMLEVGGRLAVVCYVEHPGGREEAQAVEELLTREADGRFRVLRVANPLALNAPFLLVAEKRKV